MGEKNSSKMVKELCRLYLYSILLVLVLIGGTLRSFAQCTDPTITRKDYCPSQPAYINVVDNTSNVKYGWYTLSNASDAPVFGTDGTGRSFTSSGTQSGPTTFYYRKNTARAITYFYKTT